MAVKFRNSVFYTGFRGLRSVSPVEKMAFAEYKKSSEAFGDGTCDEEVKLQALSSVINRLSSYPAC